VPAGAAPGDPAAVPPRALAPTPPVTLPRRAIESAVAQRVGRYVAVSLVTGRAGRLRIALRRGRRTVARCSVAVVVGRSYTCRLRRPRSGRGALRVVAQLRRADGRTVTRAVKIGAPHIH
jgi:hypothetical protein